MSIKIRITTGIIFSTIILLTLVVLFKEARLVLLFMGIACTLLFVIISFFVLFFLFCEHYDNLLNYLSSDVETSNVPYIGLTIILLFLMMLGFCEVIGMNFIYVFLFWITPLLTIYLLTCILCLIKFFKPKLKRGICNS